MKNPGYYDHEVQPEALERRSAWRLLPAEGRTLSAWMFTPPAEPVGGIVMEMSGQGIGIAAPLPSLERIGVDDVFELSVGVDERDRLVTPARVIAALPLDPHWARFGATFINVGGLQEQLEVFFQEHFNRRFGVRAKPLARDVVRAQVQWPGGQLTARVEDLSVSGLALSISPLSTIALKPGTVVSLRFRLPGAVRSITGQATIRYVAELPRNRVIGLEFDLDDPRGIAGDLPLVQAFVGERLAQVEAWERGWSA